MQGLWGGLAWHSCIKELNHTLAKAYGGEDRLLMCLGSQRASLYKEGLGYTPKKGKVAFAPHKTSFVKNNGRFCTSCKQVGNKEHECKNKSKMLMYPPLKLILSMCLLRVQMV